MSQTQPEQAAQVLLRSIFEVSTSLVRGERASLLLREGNGEAHFVIAMARGIAEEVWQRARIREGEGIAGQVAKTRRGLLVRTREDAPIPIPHGTYHSDSFISVPILVEDRAQGVLNVTERADGTPFDAGDLQTLQTLANHIAACLVQSRVDDELRRLAETDPLTRLFNRRHFDRRLDAEFRRAQRTGEPLGLLILDVNSFKTINDRLGHRIGDDVLRLVAEAIRRNVRAYDVSVRYGGDEFAVILPNAEARAADRVGERIVTAVATAIPKDVLASVPGIGLSVGAATIPPAVETRALVDGADAAMNRAKAAGGGVAIWTPETPAVAAATPRVQRQALPAPYLADPKKLARVDLQQLLPAAVAEEWNVLVIGREGDVLTVVMPGPSNAATAALSSATGLAIFPVYSAAADIEAARRSLSG